MNGYDTNDQDSDRQRQWREHVLPAEKEKGVCAGYEPRHGYELEVTNEQDSEREL